MYEQICQKVAKLINDNQTEKIIWTKISTESINFITQSYFRSRFQSYNK
ncbi:MAG TPA: aminotransferase class V-fold PLP-dependent enzyme [Arsenophonus nasoniae]